MSGKKIVVAQILRQPFGGIRKHVLAIIVALEQSPDFDWVLITDPSSADEAFVDFLDKNPSFRDKLIPIAIPKSPSLLDIANIIALRSKLAQLNATILHGHGAKGGLYARLVSRLIKAKSIYTPHGGSLHNMFGRAKKAIYLVIEKALYPLTDLCVAESNYTKNQYINQVSKSERRIVLNRNGIALPTHAPPTPKFPAPHETLKIGAFGMLRTEKGHDIFLHSLKLLKEKGYACEFHIYGDGDQQGPLLQLAKQLGAENQFFIHNHAKNVPKKMAKMDIIVHPSRFESFGYVPLEAMLCKRPVVASAVGGLVEVIENGVTGLLVTPPSPEAFAQAVERLIVDANFRDQLIARGWDTSRSDFSEDNMINSLKSIYRGLSEAPN